MRLGFVVATLLSLLASTWTEGAARAQSTAAAASATPAPVDLANARPRAFDDRMAAELSSYIAGFVERARVPGAAVSIVQSGKVVYARGFGVRELGKLDLVNPQTLMMIGSTGKSMTTMMMAALVDEGRIA